MCMRQRPPMCIRPLCVRAAAAACACTRCGRKQRCELNLAHVCHVNVYVTFTYRNNLWNLWNLWNLVSLKLSCVMCCV